MLFLAGCSHPPTAPATAALPRAMQGQVVSMETGADLKVVVSFRNDGAAACRVTSYALAWGNRASAPRAKCDGVALVPNAEAKTTCVIPDSSPMRDAAGGTEADLAVVDVESDCQASK
jgi:hypothetical protein